MLFTGIWLARHRRRVTGGLSPPSALTVGVLVGIEVNRKQDRRGRLLAQEELVALVPADCVDLHQRAGLLFEVADDPIR